MGYIYYIINVYMCEIPEVEFHLRVCAGRFVHQQNSMLRIFIRKIFTHWIVRVQNIRGIKVDLLKLNDYHEPEDAIAALKIELLDFINVFENKPLKTITNPFFGELNFEEWTFLLNKHFLE